MGLAGANSGSTDAESSANLLKDTSSRTYSQRAGSWSGLCAAVGVVAALALNAPAATASRMGEAARGYTLTALSQDFASTVLTLEPGIVGIQSLYRFTPKTLQGSLCAAPSNCQAVDYLTLPGDGYNEKGATKLLDAVRSLPTDAGPVTLLGYSQGAQVIYSALRRWEAEPSTAPDSARVSWVSIGNPDNPIGGHRTKLGTAQPRPAETPYGGTEVIRQYDGWADWPDDRSNLLAVFNAVVGMTTVHSNYFDVDIKDPANVRYTPDRADGSPGNVTYVWVPNPVLPLVAGFGPLAPVLDPLLRPRIEAAYNRPVPIPVPGAQAGAVSENASAAAQPNPAAADSSSRAAEPNGTSSPVKATPPRNRQALATSRSTDGRVPSRTERTQARAKRAGSTVDG